MSQIDIEEKIKEINLLIEENNKLVKKGQNCLETKYFFITKEMSNYIEAIIKHNQKEFLNKVKNKSKVKIIDIFAGSGMFTLMFSRFLLELFVKNKIKVENFNIILNDKMYNNYKLIDQQTLGTNFENIHNNLNSKYFISTTNYDITKYENEFDNYIDEKSSSFVIANPMYISISKGKEHYKPISFLNEDMFLESSGIEKLLENFISQSDYFIYLTKQLSSNLSVDTHKNQKIYLNDYTDLTITEIDKKRYEIFNPANIEKIKEENFWKFTNNQKEDFNTIIIFEKNSFAKKSKFKYVYNAIYGTNDQDTVKTKINKIKLKLEKLKLNEIIDKYNILKEQL